MRTRSKICQSSDRLSHGRPDRHVPGRVIASLTPANDSFSRARLTHLFSEAARYPKKDVTIELQQNKGPAVTTPGGPKNSGAAATRAVRPEGTGCFAIRYSKNHRRQRHLRAAGHLVLQMERLGLANRLVKKDSLPEKQRREHRHKRESCKGNDERQGACDFRRVGIGGRVGAGSPPERCTGVPNAW